MKAIDKTRYCKGKHPNSLKNLRPFQKGNSGNLNGRPPKDVSLTSLLKKYIETTPALIDGKPNTKTWRELLVETWVFASHKGNPVLFKELLERLEGKVTQPVSGEGGGPIAVKIEVVSEQAKKFTEEIVKGARTTSADDAHH